MFWKFVVGALVLPGCLGLEIATASLGKDNTNILPKSEELELSLAKTQDYKDVETPLSQTTSESSTIPAKQEVDTKQVTEGADMPLKISHRRYYRRPCYRRRRYRRNYYRRRRYHPAYYRRHRRRYRRNRYHRHHHRHYYRRGHRRRYYRHRHYHRH